LYEAIRFYLDLCAEEYAGHFVCVWHEAKTPQNRIAATDKDINFFMVVLVV